MGIFMKNLISDKQMVMMYNEITNHSKFSRLGDVQLMIDPVMVNPKNNTIEGDDVVNTKLRFWVEVIIPGCYTVNEMKEYHISNPYHSIHDWELDSGGDTYHEAVKIVYDKFIKKYGKSEY